MGNKEFQKNLIEALKNEGLVIMPKNIANYSVKYYEKQRQLLARNLVTPYEVVKWDLLNGVKSIKTVKNMVKDFRIRENEHVYKGEKLYIFTRAIKRIKAEIIS